MEDAAHQVEEAAAHGDVTRMTVANRLLHDTLIEACQLPRLVRMIRQLWDATEVYRTPYYGDELNRDRVIHEHRDLRMEERRRRVNGHFTSCGRSARMQRPVNRP